MNYMEEMMEEMKERDSEHTGSDMDESSSFEPPLNAHHEILLKKLDPQSLK